MRPIGYFMCFAVLVLTLAFVPVPATADTFSLNVAFCTTGCAPGSGPWGSVTLLSDPNLANAIDVTVSLVDPLIFHDQGLTSFAFNGPAGLGSSNFVVLSPGNTTWTFIAAIAQNTLNTDGAGHGFMYGFECAAGPNGCALPTQSFEFQISGLAPGTPLSAFETRTGFLDTSNPRHPVQSITNVDFAANAANTNGTGCTGMIGGGNGTADSTPSGGGLSPCTPTNQTPEPASLALLGTGLLVVGGLARRWVGR